MLSHKDVYYLNIQKNRRAQSEVEAQLLKKANEVTSAANGGASANIVVPLAEQQHQQQVASQASITTIQQIYGQKLSSVSGAKLLAIESIGGTGKDSIPNSYSNTPQSRILNGTSKICTSIGTKHASVVVESSNATAAKNSTIVAPGGGKFMATSASSGAILHLNGNANGNQNI